MKEFAVYETRKTRSEAETLAWAENFAKTLAQGSVIALFGTLGAGKTVISRGICQGLGFAGQVNSPTYTIVHEYPNLSLPIYHLDLYRLPPHADLEEIGIDYYASQKGVTLIEWPERLDSEELLTHKISISIADDETRVIEVSKRKNDG
ncbi:tRNA (adenosine(37)-N6)-threonylcarbamoyltransferase complex ATPase subunit type 1 TsaE [uncultured Fibrobacter sp.]|uniref:tRNA (adenosine(37)-N6)-threonylcarbamoyltransferase complex ATPase subunit type 1 TsaE n=1 Tax=uncultured Fibrobacter sp. TaxID=261512 RepID=UPI002804891E|nr:tRNA (adenosine(37)-N6)-threonylcarbamoyltransferase complex ATPase subunit type 1 TsaE [uncultured Fibrobacter sp.]